MKYICQLLPNLRQKKLSKLFIIKYKMKDENERLKEFTKHTSILRFIMYFIINR